MTRSWGSYVNDQGDLVVRDFPIDWVSSLPASGEFPGHMAYLTSGSTGLYYWDGSIWMGPLGVSGGGGGAPVGAAYLTLAVDATLTNERVLTPGPSLVGTDGGPGAAYTLVRAALTGDVTAPQDSNATTIPNNTIDNPRLADVASQTLKGRTTAGSGDPEDLTAAQARTLLNVADGANAYVHPNHSGDVTSVGDGAQTIAVGVVTNAKLADMVSQTIKGRITAGTGIPEDLTAAQVRTLINVADGANAYVHPNHSGDVVSVGDGAQTIQAGVVTYAKMQNVSAVSKLLGRNSATTGPPEEITLGTNLSMSGNVLNAAGGGGPTPTGTGFRHVTGGVEDAAAKLVDTADVNPAQITNAKLANMATQTIKGRTTAGSGDPEDLTAAQTRTILNVADGANNYVHPNHSGDVVSVGDGATTIQVGVVTDAKLRNSVALSVIGRSTGTAGVPADIAAGTGTHHVLRENSGTIGFGQIHTDGILDNAVTFAKMALMTNLRLVGRPNVGAGIPQEIQVGTNFVFDTTHLRMADMAAQTFKGRKGTSGTPEDISYAGTTFPSSPAAGQPFYRTDLHCGFRYDATALGWLSDAVYQMPFGDPSQVASVKYSRWWREQWLPRFSATNGHAFGFDVVVVGMILRCPGGTPSTATVSVTDDGVIVTGGSISLSASSYVSNDNMLSNPIAADSIIGVVVASGTLLTNHDGWVRFRRRET